MNIKKIAVLLIELFCLMSMLSTEKQVKEYKNIKIESLSYTKGSVNIQYPYVTIPNDSEKQKKVNAVLKKESFRELDALVHGGYMNVNDISLFIEYSILYQDNKYLCINYIGFLHTENSAYPRNLFYTINIDIIEERKLRLSDLVEIDNKFVNTIKNYLNLYIENKIENTVDYTNKLQKYSDYAIVYKSMLENEDKYFLKILQNADSATDSDCFSYFTKDAFGLSFATSFQSGNHFEIEIDYKDMKEHVISDK